MDWVMTLLPLPDSPTIATISLRAISKFTPRTACTSPAYVLKETLKSFISRMLLLIMRSVCHSVPQFGIERIAQPIADQLEGKHGQADHHTGQKQPERIGIDLFHAHTDQQPPGSLR